MADQIGTETNLEELSCLQECIDENLLQHIKVMEDVSVVATNEFEDKLKLDLMKEEWKDIRFELNLYKSVPLFLLINCSILNCLSSNAFFSTGTLERRSCQQLIRFKKLSMSTLQSLNDFLIHPLSSHSLVKWKSGLTNF